MDEYRKIRAVDLPRSPRHSGIQNEGPQDGPLEKSRISLVGLPECALGGMGERREGTLTREPTDQGLAGRYIVQQVHWLVSGLRVLYYMGSKYDKRRKPALPQFKKSKRPPKLQKSPKQAYLLSDVTDHWILTICLAG